MQAAFATLLARLTGSRFRRNTFLLVRANVLTQALLLLATPVLTRLFDPEDFGVAGLFVTGATLFAAFASLRFEWSIPSAKTDHDADGLLIVSLILSAVFALLALALLTLPDQKWLFGLIGAEPVPFAPLMVLMALATTAAPVLSSAYVRSGDLESVSHSRYMQNGAQLVASLATGFAGMGAFGLALSSTIAAGSALIALVRRLPRQIWTRLGDIPDLIGVARRYIRQAGTSTMVSLMNFAFANCLPLLLLLGYSVREVGFYFVAMRLATGPTALLSTGISSSFWSETATLAKTDPVQLRRFYLKMVGLLGLLSIPIVLVCLAAPFFLPLVLGPRDWSEIGIVVAACAPQIVGGFIFSSTNHLIVYDRQGYQLFSDLLSVLGSVGALFACRTAGLPFWVTILAISTVILLAYLLRFALHLKANSETIRAFRPV